MANVMTSREYQEVKNETYTLVRFKNGKRVGTTGGCSLVRLVKELLEINGELVTLVINDKDCVKEDGKRDLMIAWDIEYYERYFKMQRKLF